MLGIDLFDIVCSLQYKKLKNADILKNMLLVGLGVIFCLVSYNDVNYPVSINFK